MRYYIRLFLLALLSCAFSFCSSFKNGQASIKQGVVGKVVWVEGNLMPSPDRPKQQKKIPTVRTVYIYKLTKFSNTEGELPLFSNIKSDLVAKVKTNKQGFFQRRLAPGKYSIFTQEEDGKFFANLSNGDGYIAPFEVKASGVTQYDIMINYKAAY